MGFLAGCYPGLALATAMPGGKRVGKVFPSFI